KPDPAGGPADRALDVLEVTRHPPDTTYRIAFRIAKRLCVDQRRRVLLSIKGGPVRNRRFISALALATALSFSAAGCFATVGDEPASGGTVVFANTGGALAAIFAETAYKQLADQGIQVAEESPNNEAK